MVTPPTVVPLTVSGAPSYVPDQAAMSGSAAMLRAAGAVDVPNCSLVTSASQATPYSRGVASRYPRLALNPSAALSPTTPTAVAAIADRTGTAVRPAPRCSANRTPVAAGTDRTERVAASTADGRPGYILATGSPPAAPALACAARQAGHAATPTVATSTPPAPSSSAVQSASMPGCGSAIPASPTGNTGEMAIAVATASTAPAPPISAARASPAAVSWRGTTPIARSVPESA